MTATPLTFRVFLSASTLDMREERKHLYTVVFPALRRRYEPRGVALEVIDPRLRTSSAAEAESVNQVEGTLQRLESGERYWFLAVLGERFGPVLTEFPVEAVRRFPWLRGVDGSSLLELEIIRGFLLRDAPPLPGLFYFRDPTVMADVPDKLLGTYLEGNQTTALRIAELKQTVRDNDKALIREYRCRWDGRDGRMGGLTRFGEQVAADLSWAIDFELRSAASRSAIAPVLRPQEFLAPLPLESSPASEQPPGADLAFEDDDDFDDDQGSDEQDFDDRLDEDADFDDDDAELEVVEAPPVSSEAESVEFDGGEELEVIPAPPESQLKPIHVDENVQFTVYRPRVVRPQQWYPLLAFAHLSERPADAPPTTPDPVAEVYRQAKEVLGKQAKDYQEITQDSRASVPREGEITFVPEVPGIQFNPPRSTFLWQEPVHRVEFRLRASPELDGKTARGRLTVFLGSLILADVALSIRVDSTVGTSTAEPAEQESARPYRKIFASYSHRDLDVVKQVEHFCLSMGDQYLRDWTHLRAGEVWNDRLMRLIEEADVFQLFWSRNAMASTYCKQEWEHALKLGRPNFVRPVYWEEPLPSSPDGTLPPEELRRLHFQRLFTEALTHPTLQPIPTAAPPPMPVKPSESRQYKLDRVRAPRTQITYEIETAAAAVKTELPFVVGVLADLSGHPKEPTPFRSRKFLPIDRDNFNDVLARLAPRLLLHVPDRLGSGGSLEVELNFRRFDDFSPARVAAQIPSLRELLAQRGRMPQNSAAKVAIDRRLSAQLREVLGHPDFRQLESSWRGLYYLVYQSETSEFLKIRVLDVSKRELLEDLERAAEFDQSQLFKKVYEAEYGHLGGEPYGLLVGDYSFGRQPEDVALLKRIASVGATAHAPFVAAAAPQLFGFQSWAELATPRDLIKIFDGIEYTGWKSFRDSEDSRYVALTLPRVLARLPYGDHGTKVEAFPFEELADGTDPSGLLWMSAAWAYAVRITDAFARGGWFARIRGVEGGGRVEGLPTWTVPADDGGTDSNCPTEVALSDRREFELSNLGLLPLLYVRSRHLAAFLGAQSCQRPKKYEGAKGAEASANAELSTKLNRLLCVLRFAQYLKLMARDRLGSFMEVPDCERWLNAWINNYVLENPEAAGPDSGARQPLREAKVEMRPVKGNPGYYEVVAWLRPHFQLESLTTSMRLAIVIPKRAVSAGEGVADVTPALPAATSPANPVYVDENVQFTVYRPRVVQPMKWYPLLAFAHLSERPADAPASTPDPVAEVYRQAKEVLGKQAKDYHEVTQDSRVVVPREGEITFVPEIPGVEFNPPRRTFLWQEPVHREEFRLRAGSALNGKTVRGRLTVFLGSLILADVSLTIRVDSRGGTSAEEPAEQESARPYRKIFASYSHRDLSVVQQIEHFCRAMGDEYLRDWTHLRSGEVWNDRLMHLIEEADVFQLFWSQNSMRSAYCRQEWEHALRLGRANFIRPVYWEEPLPATPDGSLPPDALRRLHFQKLFVEGMTHPAIPVEAEPIVSAEDEFSGLVYAPQLPEPVSPPPSPAPTPRPRTRGETTDWRTAPPPPARARKEEAESLPRRQREEADEEDEPLSYSPGRGKRSFPWLPLAITLLLLLGIGLVICFLWPW